MTRILLAGALTLALSAPAHAEYQYPAQPDNPTWQDCSNLAQEYHAILSEMYEQQRACQSEEPQFGRATRCDGSYGAVPWAQCQNLALEICQIDDDKRTAVNTCRIWASANVSGGGTLEDLNRFQEVVRTGDQIHGAWRNASSLLNDPGAFLRNALQGRLTRELQNQFAPQGDLSRDGEELYRHLFQATRYGTNQTPNPVVSMIQGELLSYLEARFGDLLYQLDEASAASARLSTE